MRRWLAFVFLGLLAGALVRQIQVETDSQYHGERGPYLQRLTPASAVVRWQTAEPSATRLHLDGLIVQDQSGLNTQHRIQLQHLNPATTYSYSIDPDAAQAQHFNFTTPPSTDNQNTPIRLWVLGDPGSNSELHQTARQSGQQWLVQNQRTGLPLLDLWLTTGDNAYTSGRNREYQTALFAPYQDWMGQFALLPVIGNHDLRRRAYRRIFEFSDNGEQGGVPSGSQHYFALDRGAVHLVVLDSVWSIMRERRAMLDWLERDLQANTRPWTIAIFHHPPYTKGSHDSDDTRGSDKRIRLMREHVLPILDRHNADLVLSGHSHVYERSHLLNGHYGKSATLDESMILTPGQGPGDQFRKTSDCELHCGTVYQVLGSTAELRPGSVDHPAMAVGLNQGGTLVIDVEPGCLRSRFLNDKGEVADAFVISKDAECS